MTIIVILLGILIIFLCPKIVDIIFWTLIGLFYIVFTIACPVIGVPIMFGITVHYILK